MNGMQFQDVLSTSPNCLACFLENCAKDDLVHVQSCDERSSAQQFVLASASEGFTIKQYNSLDSQCLTADSESIGSLVRMMPCTSEGPGQTWMLDPHALSGPVTIGDLCLDRTARTLTFDILNVL